MKFRKGNVDDDRGPAPKTWRIEPSQAQAIDRWLAMCCDLTDPRATTYNRDAYGSYLVWCNRSNKKSVPPRLFAHVLHQLGLRNGQVHQDDGRTATMLKGLALLVPLDRSAEPVPSET